MKTERILVANLKTNCCEKTIKGKISEIDGVDNVMINQLQETITIQHFGNAKTEDFTDKLHSIGYREYTIL